MFKEIAETIPPPVLIGLIAYGAISTLLAPELTIRFGQKSALPDCVSGIEARQSGSDGDTISRDVARAILGVASEYFGGSPAGVAAGQLAGRLNDQAIPGQQSSPQERCQCLLEAAAFDSHVRFDGTLWVGTLRFVEGSGISTLAGHMARKSREGFCKAEGVP